MGSDDPEPARPSREEWPRADPLPARPAESPPAGLRSDTVPPDSSASDAFADETTAVPPPADGERPAARRPSPALVAAGAAITLAVVALAVDVVAISFAVPGENLIATILALVAIVLAVAAVIAGVVALAGRGRSRRSRTLAIAGIVSGLVSNPFLVVRLLAAVGGQPGA